MTFKRFRLQRDAEQGAYLTQDSQGFLIDYSEVAHLDHPVFSDPKVLENVIFLRSLFGADFVGTILEKTDANVTSEEVADLTKQVKQLKEKNKSLQEELLAITDKTVGVYRNNADEAPKDQNSYAAQLEAIKKYLRKIYGEEYNRDDYLEQLIERIESLEKIKKRFEVVKNFVDTGEKPENPEPLVTTIDEFITYLSDLIPEENRTQAINRSTSISERIGGFLSKK